MKYTKIQKEQLKNKNMKGFNRYTMKLNSWKPLITHDREFYIIESKINNPFLD